LISEQSQKLIARKWLGIEDKKVLLQFARHELINYIDSSETAKEPNVIILRRAKNKAILTLFAPILLIIAVAFHVYMLVKYAGVVRRRIYTEIFMCLIAVGVCVKIYRDKSKLITCYEELMRESESESSSKSR
jgi:hypothetical protein